MMTPTHVQDCLGSSDGISPQDFVFIVCQQGAEAAIKQDFVHSQSPLRLAFSRPGLITFKVDSGLNSVEKAQLKPQLSKHPLIRLHGTVLEQVAGSNALELAEKFCGQAALAGAFDGVHVFERDRYQVGFRGFEPGISLLASEIANLLSTRLAANAKVLPINQTAQIGQRILDCMIVEPDRWLIGWHGVSQVFEAWPGGVFPFTQPPVMVSRAYLKMAESLAWSGLPFQPGDLVVEIGSAPGGAAQRLLDLGLNVTGIDPAEMDPVILEHKRFVHWRSKSSGIKRRSYHKFKWLVADANVAPNYTLDCVGDIVTYPTTRLQGLILTLKLSSYELLDHLGDYLDRIRSWGFTRVQARQLGHNRRELCVVAAR
jgi:23S rRNA (cytidine2498-2'-O)-methyltransferase